MQSRRCREIITVHLSIAYKMKNENTVNDIPENNIVCWPAVRDLKAQTRSLTVMFANTSHNTKGDMTDVSAQPRSSIKILDPKV
jgi:hypothetical protein